MMPQKRKSSATEVATRTLSTRAKKKARVPTLKALTGTPVTRDPCGGFRRRRQWQVENPEQGLIVQHVTRAFENVERWDSASTAWAAVADIDAYVTGEQPYATVAEYWEAWEVDEDGTVDNNEDSFALCSIVPDDQHVINTTKGKFTITGRARFYPTTRTAASLGFTGAVGPAGLIANRNTDPALTIAGSGAEIVYELVATWNSRYTRIIPPSADYDAHGYGADPYVPDSEDVYTQVEEATYE
jgi:hypothetical protein